MRSFLWPLWWWQLYSNQILSDKISLSSKECKTMYTSLWPGFMHLNKRKYHLIKKLPLLKETTRVSKVTSSPLKVTSNSSSLKLVPLREYLRTKKMTSALLTSDSVTTKAILQYSTWWLLWTWWASVRTQPLSRQTCQASMPPFKQIWRAPEQVSNKIWIESMPTLTRYLIKCCRAT